MSVYALFVSRKPFHLTKEQRSERLWLLRPNKSVGLKSGVVKTLTVEILTRDNVFWNSFAAEMYVPHPAMDQGFLWPFNTIHEAEAKLLDEKAVEDCLNIHKAAPVHLQFTDSDLRQESNLDPWRCETAVLITESMTFLICTFKI